MDYTIRVLAKCRDYGFRVFMDPHQDTVRFSLSGACLFLFCGRHIGLGCAWWRLQAGAGVHLLVYGPVTPPQLCFARTYPFVLGRQDVERGLDICAGPSCG